MEVIVHAVVYACARGVEVDRFFARGGLFKEDEWFRERENLLLDDDVASLREHDPEDTVRVFATPFHAIEDDGGFRDVLEYRRPQVGWDARDIARDTRTHFIGS